MVLMKSGVCGQKPWCRLLVTQDGTCCCPSLQCQPAYNTCQSHKSVATQSHSERRKRGRGKKEKARSYHLPAVSTAPTRWKPGEGMALGPGCVQRSIPAPSVSCHAKGCPRSSPTDVGLFNILSPVVCIGLVGEERHLCLLEFGSQFFLCETQQSQGGCRCRNHSPVTAPCSYSMHF